VEVDEEDAGAAAEVELDMTAVVVCIDEVLAAAAAAAMALQSVPANDMDDRYEEVVENEEAVDEFVEGCKDGEVANVVV